ncbi:MAG: GntR family transcriptional regulator [Mariniblastus sp.]
MKINTNSTVPVFRQIVQEIQSLVAAGIYREEESIPSARELSIELNVNPNTVQKAFDELSLLGVIETRRGLGKFVCKGANKHSAKRSKQELFELFQEGIQMAIAAGMSRADVDQIYSRAAKSLKARERVR